MRSPRHPSLLAAVPALLAVLAGLLWLVLGEGETPVRPAPVERDPGGGTASVPTTSTDGPEPTAPGAVRERVEIGDTGTPGPGDGRSDLVTRSTFRIVVLDGEDRPVPGVTVEVLGEHEPRVTDASGATVIRRDPPVADLVVLAPSVVEGPVHLKEGVTVLRATDLLPVFVEFLDMETGEPVAVRPRGIGGPARSEIRLEPGPARPGHPLELDLVVDPPEGYAPRPVVVRRRAVVSRRAERVRVRVPLARATSLAARVEHADGTAAAGATVTVLAGSAPEDLQSATTDDEGRASLGHVPFVRGATLLLRADDGNGRIAWSAPVALGTDAAGREIDLVLPAEPGELGAPEVDGPAGPQRSDPTVREHGTSRILLTVLDRDWRPVPGVRIALRGPARRDAVTNAEGRADMIGLPAGRYLATLREPGMTQEIESVEVDEGETVEATIRETPGQDAVVRVVDPDGRPVPGARVELVEEFGDSHVQLTDGLQEVDLITDSEGRCLVRGIGQGDARVIVRRGPLTTTANLADGPEIVLGR